MSERDAEFVEFVQMRGPALRRTAFLMCGDWHRAEDVLQTALIKLYRSWSRIRDTTAEAYARQVVVRTLIDESRRFRWRRERTTDTVPETVAPAVEVEDGLDVRRALEQSCHRGSEPSWCCATGTTSRSRRPPGCSAVPRAR